MYVCTYKTQKENTKSIIKLLLQQFQQSTLAYGILTKQAEWKIEND